MASSGSAISKTTHKVLTGGGSKGIQDAQEAKTNPKPTHLPNTPIRMEALSSYATSVQSIKLGDGASKFTHIIFNSGEVATYMQMTAASRTSVAPLESGERPCREALRNVAVAAAVVIGGGGILEAAAVYFGLTETGVLAAGLAAAL